MNRVFDDVFRGFDLAPFGSFHTDDHTLKLGVNYRFNFASPVVERY